MRELNINLNLNRLHECLVRTASVTGWDVDRVDIWYTDAEGKPRARVGAMYMIELSGLSALYQLKVITDERGKEEYVGKHVMSYNQMLAWLDGIYYICMRQKLYGSKGVLPIV